MCHWLQKLRSFLKDVNLEMVRRVLKSFKTPVGPAKINVDGWMKRLSYFMIYFSLLDVLIHGEKFIFKYWYVHDIQNFFNIRLIYTSENSFLMKFMLEPLKLFKLKSSSCNFEFCKDIYSSDSNSTVTYFPLVFVGIGTTFKIWAYVWPRIL